MQFMQDSNFEQEAFRVDDFEGLATLLERLAKR